MKHAEISAKGLEYTLLRGENGEDLIGIEIVCNLDSNPKTRKFVEKFPEFIYQDGWRINFWAKGIALATGSERVEIALPKKEMAELRLLFDRARPERKLNMVSIYGKYPGFQLLSESI
jgi:hypothetical protein